MTTFKAKPAFAALAVAVAAIAALNGLNYLLEHPNPPPAAPVHRPPPAPVVKRAPGWECEPMPDRDHACANLAQMKREAHPNGTENRTAPFVVFTADRKSFRHEGQFLEVVCSNGSAIMAALQDRHGTRYGAAYVGESPKHTRELAASMCAAN